MQEIATHAPSSLSRLSGWWVDQVCRHMYLTLVVAALLGGGAFAYATHNLGFNTNTRDMLAADLPFRQTYQRFEQGFPQYANNILVVIDANSPESARHAAKQLATRLKKQPNRFVSVYLPRANAFMENHALLYQGMDKLEDNADNLATMQPFLGRLSADLSLRGLFLLLKDTLEAEDTPDAVDITRILAPATAAIAAVMGHQHAPLSWQELMQGELSGEVIKQRQQFILLQPRMDFNSFLAAKPAIQAIKNAASALQLDADHGIRVRLTGSAALSYDELVSVSTGAGTAALLALLLVSLLLTIGLGSFRFVVATLLCLITGLILTAAFAALTIGHLNLISVAFAVLYIGLGVDYAIHLCLRCREIEQTGETTVFALRKAADDVGVALFLCAVTTAVGFYCFAPTDYAGVSELGLISGSGMFISLAVTLTLLPAILCVWNKLMPLQHNPVITAKKTIAWRFSTILSLDTHASTVRILALAAALVAALSLPQARFDYNPINLRDQASESVTTYKELVASHNISPSSIMVLTPDAERVKIIQQRLNRLDTVDKTISLLNFIPSNQDEKLAIIDDMSLLLSLESAADKPVTLSVAEQMNATEQLESALNRYITDFSQSRPDHHATLQKLDAFRQLYQTLQSFSHQLASQSTDEKQTTLMALNKDLLGTLPATLKLLETSLAATPVSRQSIPASLSQRWLSDSGLYRIEVMPKEDIGDIEKLRRFVAQVREIAPDATGAPVFTLEAGNAVIRAFVYAFALAFVLIFLLLLLLLRKLSDTLLILLPLLLAALLTTAGAVLFDIPFNFANVIALPLLLGIGVDNGIHMVQRFRYMQSDLQHGHRNLMRSSTSKAVVLSALTTICSFGALSFSPHQGTADMGQLLTLGIILILICTLVVLPAFLQWHPGEKNPETGARA